jgi:hypothetical protein
VFLGALRFDPPDHREDSEVSGATIAVIAFVTPGGVVGALAALE